MSKQKKTSRKQQLNSSKEEENTHQQKLSSSQEAIQKLCENGLVEQKCLCGCGQKPNRGNWVWSHWLKGKKFPCSIDDPRHISKLKGRHLSEEHKKKISEHVKKTHWNKGLKGSLSPFWKGGANRPELKMYKRMRRMIHRCLDQHFRTKNPWRTYELGYTPSELKCHLEKLWKPGMTWENYGKGHGKWQIDHIRPVTSFPLDTSPAIVNALSNLQPLWYTENMEKFTKIIAK